MILHFALFSLLESAKDGIKFEKQPKKESAKTDTYNVIKDGSVIGLVKWSSRVRGYAFLPTTDCQDDVKEFIKGLMNKRKSKS